MKHILLFVVLTLLFQRNAHSKIYNLGLDKWRAKAVEVDRLSDSVVVQFNLEQFESKKIFATAPLKGMFDHLTFGTLEKTSQEGHPTLPYKSFIVIGRPHEIAVRIEKGPEFLFPELRPLPAPRRPCRCSKMDVETAMFKASAFRDSGSLVRVEALGDYRGTFFSKIIMTPTLFKDSKGLAVFPRLRIEIEGGQLFDANEIIQEANREMIIVYPDELEEGALAFKEFKEEQRYDVELYKLSSVGPSPKDLAKFFHERFKQSKYQYALLVGHEGNMPTHMVTTSFDVNTPSDLPNFLMGGEEDKIPDVHHGRLVANNNNEILRQVQKLREYQLRSWKKFNGVHHYIGIASDEGFDPTDVEYLDGMVDGFDGLFGWKPNKFLQESNDSTVPNITQALNQGALWLNYIGHGLGDSWSSIYEGEFRSKDIKKIESGLVKPIIIDVSCQNGRFSYQGKLGERFMNEHKRGEPIGALAYYGGSVDITWHPPAIMAVAISKTIRGRSEKTLFGAILVGQLHLLGSHDDLEAAAENLRWYHLLGDPSLELSF